MPLPDGIKHARQEKHEEKADSGGSSTITCQKIIMCIHVPVVSKGLPADNQVERG